MPECILEIYDYYTQFMILHYTLIRCYKGIFTNLPPSAGAQLDFSGKLIKSRRYRVVYIGMRLSSERLRLI